MINYVLAVTMPEGVVASPAWGYQMYSAMLTRVSEEYGTLLHRSGLKPVAQYLQVSRRDGSCLWRVSLLDEQAQQVFSPVLEEVSSLQLGEMAVSVQVVDRTWIRTGEEMIRRGERIFKDRKETWMRFRTTTTFKEERRYVRRPTQELVLGNLLHRWNVVFPESARPREGLSELGAGLQMSDGSLRDSRFRLKKVLIPGFTGEVSFHSELEGESEAFWHGLLAMSAFTGVGIKTTLGMGGTQVHW